MKNPPVFGDLRWSAIVLSMALTTAVQAADSKYYYHADDYYTTLLEENASVPLGGAFVCSGEFPREPSSPFKGLPRSELHTVGVGENVECLFYEGVDNGHNLHIRHWYFRSLDYTGSHHYVIALNDINAGEFTVNFKRVKDIILKVKASNNGIDASVANLPEYPEEGLM
ncbi:MAG: hypothetical protein WBP44_11150 [Gammaproteobacteria bacterium]|jgi:hypothetical protein